MAETTPTNEEIRNSIKRDLAEGIQRTTVDSTVVELADPLKRMQALIAMDAIAPDVAPGDKFGWRQYKLVPGGTG